MTYEEAEILVAVSRLSPSVRELLISRPEAVEACVKAVEARADVKLTGERP